MAGDLALSREKMALLDIFRRDIALSEMANRIDVYFVASNAKKSPMRQSMANTKSHLSQGEFKKVVFGR